jgi:hypothetical protein
VTDSKTVVEDLAAWLTAVWDEEADEPAPHHLGCRYVADGDRGGLLPCDCGYPAQMLAQIARDRKILALHGPNEWGLCGICVMGSDEERDPCATVRLLASPYAEREGFRPEWLVERQGVEG